MACAYLIIMCVSPAHRHAILDLTRAVLGDDARVLLFGSRADDSQRGDDIDLLVECLRPQPARLEVELRLGALIERALEGRRVDLIVVDPTTPPQPVHRVARATGVPL